MNAQTAALTPRTDRRLPSPVAALNFPIGMTVYDALHAFESHFEGGCRGKTGGRCYNFATPCTKMQQFESPL
jgi:hypothetical protein